MLSLYEEDIPARSGRFRCLMVDKGISNTNYIGIQAVILKSSSTYTKIH